MGESIAPESQINRTERTLDLQTQDIKTNTSRVLYLTRDLYWVLQNWKIR